MIKYCLAFLAGNVLIHQLSQLNTALFLQLLYSVLVIISMLFILGYFSKSYQYKSYFYTALFCCLFFLASFLICYDYVKQSLANVLPEQLEAKEIIVHGFIDSIPIEDDRVIKFNLRLQKVIAPKILAEIDYNDQLLRVSYYKHFFNDSKSKTDHHFKVGNFWQFKLKLKRPSGLLNPGGMDYEKWLFAHKIRAVGYIRDGVENQNLSIENNATLELSLNLAKDLSRDLAQNQKLLQNKLSLATKANYALDSLRQKMADKLNLILVDNEFKGIYLALILGLKDQISSEQWRVFLDSGTNHLIAISGLHIGLFAAIGFFIGLRLWSLSEFLLKRIPAQQAAALIALIFALFYSALAGFSIPTQRALIMISLALCSILFRLRLPPYLILAYALILVLLIDPMASLSVGFWLSFTAVAVILFSLSTLSDKPLKTSEEDAFLDTSASQKIKDKLLTGVKWIGQISRLQLIIFLGLLPFTLLFFSRLSLLSPLANLIAVPWMSLLLTPLVLFSAVLATMSVELSALLFMLISYLMQPLWVFLKYLITINHNLIYPDTSNLLVLIPTILAISLFFIFKTSKKRWFALILLVPLVIPNTTRWTKLFNTKIPQGEFKLSLLDVGQGLSVVLQTQNQLMVYDTGNAFSSRFNMADQVVIPFLRNHSITYIDKLILSHADHDHVGSAPSLLAQYQTKDILSGEPKRLSEKLDIKSRQCLQGQKWVWDKVRFEVLHPTRDIILSARKSNNLSCVILVTSESGQSLLLTGDIEKKVEQKIKNLVKLKTLDIIIAPHHGSKSSSSQLFLTHLKPKIVIFTNGYLNRYHFPAKQVIERYKEQASRLFSTQNGLIELMTGDPKLAIKVTEYRKDNRHYWNRAYQAIE